MGRAAVSVSLGPGAESTRSHVTTLRSPPETDQCGLVQPRRVRLNAAAVPRRIEEVDMFEMINKERAEPQDRKLLLVKIGAFIVALAVLGGVIYFFTFVSYSAH